MTKRILPSQFNKVVQFGTVDSVENDNTGDYSSEFVFQFSLHAYPSKRTISQQYQIVGTFLEDTTIIVIRHNEQVNKSLQVKYNGQIYDIVDISQDDSLNINSYDYLTIKLVK